MGYLSRLLASYYEDDQQEDQQQQKQQQKQQQQQQPLVNSSQQRSQTTQSSSSENALYTRPPASRVPSPSANSTPTPTASKSLDTANLYQNPRARLIKQLSLYVAGATFLTATTLVTRRSITRKLIATTPKFYTPSNFRPTDTNGAVEAAEAFALATINVGAVGIMMTGGAMFALDVANAQDLRDKYKRRMGFHDNLDQGADEEIEEWVQGMLEKKDGGDYKSVAEGLTALVGVLAGKEEEREKLDKFKVKKSQDMA